MRRIDRTTVTVEIDAGELPGLVDDLSHLDADCKKDGVDMLTAYPKLSSLLLALQFHA